MELPDIPIAVLDANVLYPAPVRDILLSASAKGLFFAKWTRKINEEWTYHLLRNRDDLDPAQIHRTVLIMNTAFPEAEVEGYERHIASIQLPDLQDRHVLAAALQAKAHCIVTQNLKDFPYDQLEQHGMLALHPDIFLSNLIEVDYSNMLEAFKSLHARLKNPPIEESRLLQIFDNNGLVNFSNRIKDAFK